MPEGQDRLEIAVGRAVAGAQGAVALYPSDARLRLVRGEQNIFLLRHPVALVGAGIDGNFLHVASFFEFVERLRSALFVQREFINQLAHGKEVLLHDAVAGALHR